MNWRFGKKYRRDAALHELMRLTQTGTVAAHATEFSRLMETLEYNDPSRRDYFQAGLRLDIKCHIKSFRTPDSFDHFVRLTIKLDNKLRASKTTDSDQNSCSDLAASMCKEKESKQEKHKLGDKEHHRRVTQRPCFRCGAAGHQAKSCPKNKSYNRILRATTPAVGVECQECREIPRIFASVALRRCKPGRSGDMICTSLS